MKKKIKKKTKKKVIKKEYIYHPVIHKPTGKFIGFVKKEAK